MNLVLNSKFIAFLAASLILSIGLASCFHQGFVVTVTNKGARPIKNFTISYRGGSENLSELGPGVTHKFHLHPTGESEPQLSFVDADGNTKSKKIGVYMDYALSGSINIEIDSVGEITWTAKHS